MPIVAKFLYFVKIVSTLVLVTTAGWLMSHIIVFKHVSSPGEAQFFKDNDVVAFDGSVREGYQDCLKSPSKLICIITANRQLHVIEKGSGSSFDKDPTTGIQPDEVVRHPVSAVLSDFATAMAELDIEAMLVEPSVLYCMLIDDLKVLLLKRRCDMKSILGAPNIVNFAILDKDSEKIISNKTIIEKYNFKHYQEDHYRQHRWLSERFPGEVISDLWTHHFFVRSNIAIHVVVLFRRQRYFWTSKLSAVPRELANIVKINKLLYASEDRAYERFIPRAIEYDDGFIYVPSNPVLFLLDISSSKFLECDSQSDDTIGEVSAPKPELMVTGEKLGNAFNLSSQELKFHLRQMLLNLFLWGDTLLGWYHGCSMTPLPPHIHYAVWDVDSSVSEKIRKLLSNSSDTHHLEWEIIDEIEEHMLLRIILYEVEIQVTFIHQSKDDSAFHATSYSDGNYFRYTLKGFNVCSAEFFGQLVRVPCDVEQTLRALYGSNLNKSTVFLEGSADTYYNMTTSTRL